MNNNSGNLVAKKQNSLDRFWKELKRRKVVHVITVYAATAFVILEVVDMIAQPLHFPEWTQAFIIVLLCIGFIISVVVSWVYDITPSGVSKTKPASAIKHGEPATHTVASVWKIATYVSGVIIVALVVFNILSDRQRTESEKSIAVLPFKLLSDEPDKQYLADGMMDAITLHLSKIKDLRVISRTSVEQYRNPTKTTTAIGKELDVEFLLEGSFQKFGDNVKLIVQLIKTGKEGHVWANEYDRNWSDVFTVQSEVAQTIAQELYASITPEEKKLIEKAPTENMTAYDFYLKANNYLKEYEKTGNLDSYQNAVTFYKAALSIDHSFAKAYTGLANTYYVKNKWETYFEPDYLDSMLVLIDNAIAIDDKLDEAYYLKGMYYSELGESDRALNDFDLALKYNPSYFEVYLARGNVLTSFSGDFIKCIDNYNNALNLCRIDESPFLLRNLGYAYLEIGFPEEAKQYCDEAYSIDSSYVERLGELARFTFYREKIEEGLNIQRKIIEADSTFFPIELIMMGNKEEAYLLAKRLNEYNERKGEPNLQVSHRIGYAFNRVGKVEEAKAFFNQQIRYSEESIKLKRRLSRWNAAQYDLAATYAFLDEKKKAYKYLEELNEKNDLSLWWILMIKYDPLFNSIRNEPDFQKIVDDMEAKHQTEHERVRKWLEENDML
ncbi:MAG: hypothetical protein JXB49_12825 [Bacteroidales bacterium]|nr:hypothetical protein [Bacteroidales bacterium]